MIDIEKITRRLHKYDHPAARQCHFFERNLQYCLEQLDRIRSVAKVLHDGGDWLIVKGVLTPYIIEIDPLFNAARVRPVDYISVPREEDKTFEGSNWDPEWDMLELAIREKQLDLYVVGIAEIRDILKHRYFNDELLAKRLKLPKKQPRRRKVFATFQRTNENT